MIDPKTGEEIQTKPFSATRLRDVLMSNRDLYDAAKFAADQMARAIDRAARYSAKCNREWHDDPEADDHLDFQAPDDEQYPREVRHECAADVLEYFLDNFHMTPKVAVAPAESGA